MRITKEQLKQIIKEELENVIQEEEQSITGLPIEKDVMEIFRDGIDPQAAAEKLAIMYSYEDFLKYKEAFEFGDWRGPAMNALNNFNYEVLPIMMRLG
tara:strand:- start:874 stop:1167 length:294 start_codon:yes stop_codon:yes gene_type:complete